MDVVTVGSSQGAFNHGSLALVHSYLRSCGKRCQAYNHLLQFILTVLPCQTVLPLIEKLEAESDSLCGF